MSLICLLFAADLPIWKGQKVLINFFQQIKDDIFREMMFVSHFLEEVSSETPYESKVKL